MSTQLVLDAVEHAIWARGRRGVTDLSGVIFHSDYAEVCVKPKYGDLDSDYVFVNLWAHPHGHPLTYAAVYDLVRLRRKTGIDFDPHWLRHTAATRLLRDGVGIEVVAHLLGHAHVATTTATYGHLTVEDARRAMEQVGWFTGGQVQL